MVHDNGLAAWRLAGAAARAIDHYPKKEVCFPKRA
jgi:hypothetical protein